MAKKRKCSSAFNTPQRTDLKKVKIDQTSTSKSNVRFKIDFSNKFNFNMLD